MEKAFRSFTFIGEIVFPKEASKTIKSEKNADWQGKRVSMGIKNGTNTVYVEFSGNLSKIIKTMGKKNDDGTTPKLEVPYASRNDKDVLDRVADFKKFRADFGDELKLTTITDWDFANFIEDNAPTIKGKRVVVGGSIEIQKYNGKTYTKYVPNYISLATDEDLDKTEAVFGIYFTADSINKDIFKETGKVKISGFVDVYNKDAKNKNIYVPYDFTLDFSKVMAIINGNDTDENEVKKLKARMDWMAKQFSNYSEDKTSMKVKKDKVYYCDWKCRIVRGSEEKEITMSDLSSNQREMIELGIKTFDEIKKEMRGSMQGDRIEEIRLIAPNGKNVDGAVDAELSIDDLFEKPEVKEKETKKVETKVDTTDVDDLFAGL